MHRGPLSSRFLILLAAGFAALPMLATDGYFSLGYGTASKGMAGSGVALSLGAMSAATNPAAMTGVGNEFDLGLAYFNPNRDYEVKGNPSGAPGTFGLMPGKVESGSKSFLVPSLGANWQITPKSSFGVAVYGNGGMNTNYSAPTFGSSPTGQNLSQLFIAPTYALKVSEGQSLGVSAIFAYQQFKAEGLGAFAPFSGDAGHLSNQGNDSSTGYGLRVGYLGQLTSKFSLGLAYQTRMKMGEFKKYAGLFAEQGGFDIPSSWTAGLALKPTETWTIALDVQRINYSEVKSIGNPMMPNLMSTPLGSDGGAGFGWKDMTVVKLGTQWKAAPDWTLRAGYSTGKQPVPESEVMFNILAPGVVEQHLTLGATYAIDKQKDLSFSLMRAFSKSVTGPNPMEAPGQQTITLRMDEWEFEIGCAVRF